MKKQKKFTKEQEILFQEIYERKELDGFFNDPYYDLTFTFKNPKTKNFIKMKFFRMSFNKSLKTNKYFYWIELNIFKKRKKFNTFNNYQNQFGSGSIKDLILVKNFILWCTQQKKCNFLIVGSNSRRSKIYFHYLKDYIDRFYVENGAKIAVLQSF